MSVFAQELKDKVADLVFAMRHDGLKTDDAFWIEQILDLVHPSTGRGYMMGYVAGRRETISLVRNVIIGEDVALSTSNSYVNIGHVKNIIKYEQRKQLDAIEKELK